MIGELFRLQFGSRDWHTRVFEFRDDCEMFSSSKGPMFVLKPNDVFMILEETKYSMRILTYRGQGWVGLTNGWLTQKFERVT